jgi:hypothetical protein
VQLNGTLGLISPIDCTLYPSIVDDCSCQERDSNVRVPYQRNDTALEFVGYGVNGVIPSITKKEAPNSDISAVQSSQHQSRRAHFGITTTMLALALSSLFS